MHEACLPSFFFSLRVFTSAASGVYSIFAKACPKCKRVNTLSNNGSGELMINVLTCHPPEGQFKGHIIVAQKSSVGLSPLPKMAN